MRIVRSEPKCRYMDDLPRLRSLLKDAQIALEFARHYTKELQHEIDLWGQLPAPDGHYEMFNALRTERLALARYCEVQSRIKAFEQCRATHAAGG